MNGPIIVNFGSVSKIKNGICIFIMIELVCKKNNCISITDSPLNALCYIIGRSD